MDELKVLLDSLKKSKNIHILKKVVITINVPEKIIINHYEYPFDIQIIKNKKLLDFLRIITMLFQKCSTKYFLVINPDIFIPKIFDWGKIVGKLTKKNVLISPIIFEKIRK